MLFFDGGAANGRTPDALLVLPGSIVMQARAWVGDGGGVRRRARVGPVRGVLRLFYLFFSAPAPPPVRGARRPRV